MHLSYAIPIFNCLCVTVLSFLTKKYLWIRWLANFRGIANSVVNDYATVLWSFKTCWNATMSLLGLALNNPLIWVFSSVTTTKYSPASSFDFSKVSYSPLNPFFLKRPMIFNISRWLTSVSLFKILLLPFTYFLYHHYPVLMQFSAEKWSLTGQTKRPLVTTFFVCSFNVIEPKRVPAGKELCVSRYRHKSKTRIFANITLHAAP